MASPEDQSRARAAKYVMVLDDRSIRQLANLLALPPRCGTARPAGKWLRQQAELVTRMPPQLLRPKQLLKRLAVKLTEALPTRVLPPAAVLCPAHRTLHPWVIHAVFDLLLAEVTLRCDRLQMYGDGEGDDNAEERSKIVDEVRGRLHSVNALWLDRDTFRMVFGHQYVQSGEVRLAQVVGGCEACILACIGSRGRLLSDLRANILSRERDVEPRFLRMVESWIDCFDEESAAGIRAQSDWTAAELRRARKFVWKLRRDRLSKRGEMMREFRQRKRDEAQGSQTSKRRTEMENKAYSHHSRSSKRDARARSPSASPVDSLYRNTTSRNSGYSHRDIEQPFFGDDTEPLLGEVRAEVEPGPESSIQEVKATEPTESPNDKDEEDFILNASDAATWETVTVHTTEFSTPVRERPVSDTPKRSTPGESMLQNPRPHTFPSFSIGDDGPHAFHVRKLSPSPKAKRWGRCWEMSQSIEGLSSLFSGPNDDNEKGILSRLEPEAAEKTQGQPPSKNQAPLAPKAPNIRDDEAPRARRLPLPPSRGGKRLAYRPSPPPGFIGLPPSNQLSAPKAPSIRDEPPRGRRPPPIPPCEKKRLGRRPSPPGGFIGPPSSFYPEGTTPVSNRNPPPSSTRPPVERKGFMEDEREGVWPYGSWTRRDSSDGEGELVVFRDPWKPENQTGMGRKRTESEDWSPTMFRGKDEMF